MRRALRAPLQDDRPHPAAVQFGRQPHADRAAADDGDVVVGSGSSEVGVVEGGAAGSGASAGISPL